MLSSIGSAATLWRSLRATAAGATLAGVSLAACAPAPPTPVPDGSGCTPPAGATTLPDGYWAAIVKSGTSTALTYDLICWYSLPDADWAAAEDGMEVPVPNDFYTRNNNTKLRTQSYGPRPTIVDIKVIPNTTELITPSQVNGRLAGDPVWITVGGGKIQRVEQQYVP